MFLDATAPFVLEVFEPGELVAVDTVGVVDVTARIGQGDNLGAELIQFLRGELRDVAASGDEAGLSLEGFAPGFEHVRGEVHRAVAGGFGPDEGAAPVDPLAGENTGELVGEALVLTE